MHEPMFRILIYCWPFFSVKRRLKTLEVLAESAFLTLTCRVSGVSRKPTLSQSSFLWSLLTMSHSWVSSLRHSCCTRLFYLFQHRFCILSFTLFVVRRLWSIRYFAGSYFCVFSLWQKSRLIGRGTETEESVSQRLEIAKGELKAGE